MEAARLPWPIKLVSLLEGFIMLTMKVSYDGGGNHSSLSLQE